MGFRETNGFHSTALPLLEFLSLLLHVPNLSLLLPIAPLLPLSTSVAVATASVPLLVFDEAISLPCARG